ncbi:MAG TPA: ROK family transcriptional regulator [Cellulomonas sp.]
MTAHRGTLPPSVSPWLRDGPGTVLRLFREHPDGLTTLEVSQLAGVSRTAAAQRLDLLREHGYLEVRSTTVSGRGRPAERLGLARGRGVLLVADTGATAMRLALCDAAGTVLLEHFTPCDITAGPTAVLERVDAGFRLMLRRTGHRVDEVLGIGLDVPGPVDHARGRVVSPPIMTGWHEFDIPAFLTERYHCPVIVEKDTNAMVLGEQRQVHPTVDNLVFVKIGTGVGTGLLVRGELYRGADGAAGDIGHIAPSGDGDDEPLCRCGNRGCVEAYAGGWALARDLTDAGFPAHSVDDIVALVRSGNRTALGLVRAAGRTIGAAVADIVNMINPSVIVFGGQLAALDDIILAAAREVIYRRSLPLATRNLRIEPSGIPDPGVHGLAQLVTDLLYAADRVDAQLT